LTDHRHEAEGAGNAAPAPPGGRKRRRGRRLLAWVFVFLLVIGAAIGAALVYLPVLARPVIVQLAENAGIAGVDFTIDSIGWREASLTGLTLAATDTDTGTDENASPDLAVGAARVTYDVAGLLRGRADRLVLEGVRLAGEVTEDGTVHLPLLSRFSGGEGAGASGGLADLPLDGIEVTDAQLALATPEGPHVVTVDGMLDLSTHPRAEMTLGVAGDAISLSGDITAGMSGQWIKLTADALEAEIDLPGLPGRLALANGAIALEAPGLEGGTGTLSGDLRFVRRDGDDLPLREASGRLDIGMTYEQGLLRLALPACSRVDLVWDRAQPIRAKSIDLCADGGRDVAGLRLGPAAGEPAWTVRALAEIEGFSYGALVTGQMPDLAIDARQDADRGLVVSADMSGGKLQLPGQGIELAGLRGRVTLAPGHAGEAGRLDLTRADMRDLQAAPRFAPVVASADLSLDALGEDGWTKGRISGPVRVALPAGQSLARGTVTHDLGSGRGRLSFGTGTMLFSEKGMQPQALAPVLRGVVAAVNGQASVDGSLSWTRNGVSASGATVEMEGLGLQASAARFEGISGTLEFSSLVPVRTKGPQAIAIGVVDPGVPITGGVALVTVGDNGDVVIENAQWPFAGGQLVLTSGALNTRASVQHAELAALQVNLATLLTLIDMDGLSGEGTLGGRVPIEIHDGTVFITKARLAAEPGGVLRYSSAGTDAAAERSEGANIAFKALENFRFEVLSVELDGPMDGDLALTVELKGANPELLEGYPVHLTIRTEGAFLELLRRGTVGFRALDVVRGTDQTGGVTIERVPPGP